MQYLPAVDATIAAAWIGAGIGGGVALLGLAGTVATSIVSSNNTRKAMERTVEAGTEANRATLLAAREDRLYAARAAAYEEAVAGLLHRQRNRKRGVVLYRRDNDTDTDPQPLMEYIATLESPDWMEAQARLVAYASNGVLAAFKASQKADDETWWLYDQWLGMLQTSRLAIGAGNPKAAFDAQALRKAGAEVEVAVKKAGTQDQALIDVIRAELRSKPEAALPPAALPAVRRGSWRRRKAVEA